MLKISSLIFLFLIPFSAWATKGIGSYCNSLPAVSCEVLKVENTSHQDTHGYLYTIVTYCKNKEVKTAMKLTAWNCANTSWCGALNGTPTGWVSPITVSCSSLP